LPQRRSSGNASARAPGGMRSCVNNFVVGRE
jgi:hypothetical protein